MTTDIIEARQQDSQLIAAVEAERELRSALAAAPDDLDLKFDLARALHMLDRPAEAAEQLAPVAASAPENVDLQNLLATMLERAGRYDEAIGVVKAILKETSDRPLAWLMLGNLLRTVGRTDASVAAFREAVARDPNCGDGWLGLASVRTAALSGSDITAMRSALGRSSLGHIGATKIYFALGRALEASGDTASAFDHYSRGNAMRREDLDHDPAEIERYVGRAKALFTPEFFAARACHGSQKTDPIFIVGLPRSGSTLTDRILSTHPAIESTAELPDLLAIARRLRLDRERKGGSYPELLADLSASECAALGEEYLERTRSRRTTDRPFFIDKTPNNWAHIGLIQLILPKAKIVDVRRHPLGCCLSNFRQHFAEGQEFTYALDDLGHYYRDYVGLLDHFDRVLPGRVHRVFYERLVEDIEAEARRLLEHVGVEFDPAVLRFHEEQRPVATASAEQVRRPINREGMENWQAFEPWLDPLKAALGPVLDAYPQAPPR